MINNNAASMEKGFAPKKVPSPGKGGRRSKPPRINRSVFHGTHLVLGSLIGSSIGFYGLMMARNLFGKSSPVIDYLWFLCILLGFASMALIKSQMDSIRETVYVKRIEGKMQQIRIRRRPEVVFTLLKRALLALLAAFVILGLLHYGILQFKSEVTTASSQGAFFIPTLGQDLLMSFYALALASIVLGVCELTLRATQKEGFPYLALWLFIPANLAVGLSIRYFESLLG